MKMIHHNFKLLFMFILQICLSFESQAASNSGGKLGLSYGGIVSMGQGTMGNGSDVPSATMIYTPISFFAGYNIKKIRLGVQYEYFFAGQSSDPKSSNNVNLSGKGSSQGVRLDYYDGRQALGLIYRMSEKYDLNRQTIAGTSVSFAAKNGFEIQYYRQIINKFGIVVDYTSETFDDSLTQQIKWDRISLGLVFSNFSK